MKDDVIFSSNLKLLAVTHVNPQHLTLNMQRRCAVLGSEPLEIVLIYRIYSKHSRFILRMVFVCRYHLVERYIDIDSYFPFVFSFCFFCGISPLRRITLHYYSKPFSLLSLNAYSNTGACLSASEAPISLLYGVKVFLICAREEER